MISGVLVLLVFFIFAALMYGRRIPALLAVPAMAIVMAFVAGVPAAGVATIVSKGAFALAPVFVTVIAGAMLARVTLDTGIAKNIVNFAAEYGGEQPAVVALLLSVVVAVLFMTLSGLGAIIMVGSVVLPIMMTTGVPRKIAATVFLMAFALGFIFNIVNWKFYTQLFGVRQEQMYGYAIALAAVDLAALLVYTVVSFSRSRGYATWVAHQDDSTERDVQPKRTVPWFSLITPVLPIVLYFAAGFDPIIAFIVSAVYGAVTARPRQIVRTLVAAVIRGVEDVAPAIVLFIGIGMLFTATQQAQFVAAMHPLASSSLRNPIVFVIIFGLLSPLVLYRGPLNPFGVGIAIFTVLLSAHVLPPIVLVAAVMAVVQVQNVCDPTNTQNVWVANFTGVPIIEITKRTLPYQVAVATIACITVVAGSPALFGLHPFAWLSAPAQAATLTPAGFFSSPRAAYHIAVGDDGTPDAASAVRAVVNALNAAPLRTFSMNANPNADDCARKPYSAYIRLTSTRFSILEGTDVDVGVKLLDCGGWEVVEFHDHAVFREPSPADADELGVQGVSRLREWAAANPERWSHLLVQGLAYAAGDSPTYYYSLFKTLDGNMRTYVRGGGPAFAAGLRTNDIVNKLDGRYWWEYGTYQTQARAYDGKPHAFEVDRGGRTLEVQLGEPFTT
jgi:H+/gluconate symporter-like permease